MAKEPTKAPTGAKAKTTPQPSAPAEPSHPILEALPADRRELVKELAIDLTKLDHRNPFHYSMGSPQWHSNIRWARMFLTAFNWAVAKGREIGKEADRG